MKIEDLKGYDNVMLEGDMIAWPETVAAFMKELLPYIKGLEKRVEYLENKEEQ